MLVTARDYRKFLFLARNNPDPRTIAALKEKLAAFAKQTIFRLNAREVELMDRMLGSEDGAVELTPQTIRRYGAVVAKLSYLRNDLVFVNSKTMEIKTFGGSYFSVINPESDKSGFLTANHCVNHYLINPYFRSADQLPGNQLDIGGEKIIIPISSNYVNLPNDTAFLKNKYDVPLPFAAVIAAAPPKTGEKLYMVGRPHNGILRLSSITVRLSRCCTLREIIIPEFGSTRNYIKKVIKPLVHPAVYKKYGTNEEWIATMSLDLIPKDMTEMQTINLAADVKIPDDLQLDKRYYGNKRVIDTWDFINERIADQTIKDILSKYSITATCLVASDPFYFVKLITKMELIYGHSSTEHAGGESGSIIFNAKGEVVSVLCGGGGETKLSHSSYAAPALEYLR